MSANRRLLEYVQARPDETGIFALRVFVSYKFDCLKAKSPTASTSSAEGSIHGARSPIVASLDDDRIPPAKWAERAYKALRSDANPCTSPSQLCEAGSLLVRLVLETAAEHNVSSNELD